MSNYVAAGMRRLAVNAGMFALLAVSAAALAEENDHPCTGAPLPLTDERQVVQSAECLFDGRVVKVERVSAGTDWAYRLRLLLEAGRIRTVDLDRMSGMPVDPAILEEVNETIAR